MIKQNLQEDIDEIKKGLGAENIVVVKKFYIGSESPLDAALIYVDGQVDKNVVDGDVLNPLMTNIREKLEINEGLCDYLCKRYIISSNVWLETEINNIVNMVKRGKSVVLIDKAINCIIIDSTGGKFRDISEPENEVAIRGARDGFVEDLKTNLSILRRKIKDNNLKIDQLVVGRRSQTDVALVYLNDIADEDVVNEIKRRINDIDVDIVSATGILDQLIENYPFSFFPQSMGSERTDVITNCIMDGKVAIILNGTPYVIVLPTMFIDFFQSVEDYYERLFVANFTRLLRIIATFIVITLTPMYLTLVRYNAELIPIKFITPIIQSRIGIALTPFLEILVTEIIVEFLREGGLRLPSKIAQTISVVGGIIIGDTAVRSKIVSPTTLFVVGVTVVASFLIPNYDMALSIRTIRFPMLILANFLGIFGIGIGCFFIVVNLCSLDSVGVPYFSLNLSDMKDTFIRAPMWKMKRRPKSVPNKNPHRQTDFRYKWGKTRRKKNEESGE
jgi:hypothetical protein